MQTGVCATNIGPLELADSRSPSQMVAVNIFEKEVGQEVVKPLGMWLGNPEDKAQGLYLSSFFSGI